MRTLSRPSFLFLLFLLIPSNNSFAESVSIWSPEDGYKNLDVTRKDRGHFSVYDYDRGTYLDAEVKNHGKEVEVYDYGTGEYKNYDLEKQPGGGLEVHEPYSGRYFDIDRNDVEKFDSREQDCERHSLWDSPHSLTGRSSIFDK